MLRRLLSEISNQETGGLFTFSISVADNDSLESARPVVRDFAKTSSIPINYCVQVRQNIALARNKSLEDARGDFVAMIDDDEFPTSRWLLTLFEACEKYAVDGVLGPVKPFYDGVPPRWVIKGKFHERATYPTGFLIDWTKGRTGNALLKREIFRAEAQAFRPEYLSGEDQDFFRRMIIKGHVFAWCNEAVVYEVIPACRWKRSYLLRRAWLQGRMAMVHPGYRLRRIAAAFIAVPVYAAALPFALVLSHANFMTLLTKLINHMGRILGLLRIALTKKPYLTE
jgi:glycosyltransferase involved in cell wall biosynthesis